MPNSNNGKPIRDPTIRVGFLRLFPVSAYETN